jgi:glutamate 5-kinase
MISKLESARIVLHAGKQVIIANGRTPHVLERIVAGEQVGTLFAAVKAQELSQEKVAR